MQIHKPLFTGLHILDKELVYGIENGTLLEIRGHTSSGKTQFLYSSIVKILLPQFLGGYNSSVVVLDCDCRFNAYRMEEILREHLAQMTAQNEHQSLDASAIVALCLHHIYVFQPHSSSHLLSFIKTTLPALIGDCSKTPHPISVLCVESISSHVWMDTSSGRSLQMGSEAINLLIAKMKEWPIVLFATRLKIGRGPCRVNGEWDSKVHYRITLIKSHSSDVPSSAEFIVLPSARVSFITSGGSASTTISSAIATEQAQLQGSPSFISASPPSTHQLPYSSLSPTQYPFTIENYGINFIR
ncbi:hypothetical protein BLNAU_15032 [Blattamonas nauphoetae]|uniref:RecA family profile 1 domain-containing protein n=1 Tax=Blattamonas nauphoetae TaxID=2049346 RepID=A0ABQ9XF76_9EUKA|nr:hypothetical protein BLNAU_15032 [Blattamonas nauphoetae]